MNTKEEILDKHFSMKDREIEKWKVLAAMEEYAAQFKDSPYQGSAGVWVKASERVPDNYRSVHVRYTKEGKPRRWTIRYNVSAGQWINHGNDEIEEVAPDLEWLDESAASPAGDGWKEHAIEFADWLAEMTEVIKESKIALYRYCNGMNEWGNYTLDDIYLEFLEHLKRTPSPPNTSV